MDNCKSCTWKDLLKWVMAPMISPKDEFNCPPEKMVEQYLRKTAFEFALKTGALREKFYTDLDCGVKDYPIACSTGTEVVSIKKVSVNGMALDKDDYSTIEQTVYLDSAPTCDVREGLCVEYSYAPCTDQDCEVPENFCTRYREAIINGTLAILYGMANQDWYNETQSQMHKDMYQADIAAAKTDVKKRTRGKRGNIYDIRTRFIQ